MRSRCQEKWLKASQTMLSKSLLCLFPHRQPLHAGGGFVSSLADSAGCKVMEQSPTTRSRMPLNQEASVFRQRDRLKNASGTSMSGLLSNTLASREQPCWM